MSIAPLRMPTQGPRRPPGGRDFGRARTASGSVAQRARPRALVALGKRLLPLGALALLVLLAVYPELKRGSEGSRVSYRKIEITPEGGQLSDANYHGLDEGGRPFTITAARVRQAGKERVDLDLPKADISLENGDWLMVEARQGVYEQRASRLDLSGDVTLYRDDGMVLQTEAATVDLRAGVAAGAAMVHAEGPFGVLDAQGFSVTDRGAVIHFFGPSRLVLSGTAP